MAHRLLEDDAAGLRDQAIRLKAPGNLAEQAWRGGQVDDARAVVVAGKEFRQAVPPVVREGIELQVMDPRRKRLPLSGIELTVSEVVLERLPYGVDVLLAAERRPARRDDAALTRELPVAVAVVQRRQQLAHRQVARAAEYDQVERLDRYQLGHSVCLDSV